MSSEPLSGPTSHPGPHLPAPLGRQAGDVALVAKPAQAPQAPSVPLPEQAKAPRPDPAENLRQLQEVVEKLNEEMRRNGRNLAFSVDQSLNRVVVSVKAADTGEVIRQIPDEAVLRFAHTVDRIKGLLHNART